MTMTDEEREPLPPLHELWPPEHLAARAVAFDDVARIIRMTSLNGTPPTTPEEWLAFSQTFTAGAQHLRDAIPAAPAFPERDPPGRVETHELKIWPAFYELEVRGIKTFEVRRHDRDYQPNDIVRLHEWNPETHQYSGRVERFRISFLLPGGQFGLAVGWCAFGVFPDFLRPEPPAARLPLAQRLGGKGKRR
jgi:hypothetical protein